MAERVVDNVGRVVRFDLDGWVVERRGVDADAQAAEVAEVERVLREMVYPLVIEALVRARVDECVVAQTPGGEVEVKILGIGD